MSVSRHVTGGRMGDLWLVAATLVSLSLVGIRAEDADSVTRELAAELAKEGSHEAAALEYRRLALMSDGEADRAGYYWAAAHEYWRGGSHELAARMLDRVEDTSDTLKGESLVLRAEAALSAEQPELAKFYIESLLDSQPAYSQKALACRRLARILISDGDVSGASQALQDSPSPHPQGLEALHRYEQGRDKSPKLGGFLGLVPGLGHLYAGEPRNALRSLLLNGLFIFAMADTANDEEWGAFAAVTFFELTWYTGSVYGGVDAAHRHNRNRLRACTKAVDGKSGVTVNTAQLPIVSLSIRF